MKISLIIPAYNEEKYIGNCLKSIQKNGKNFFEVIVIDNASTDNTAEIAKSFPFVKVIYESRKGPLWARQKGFEESKGEYLAFIDSDCLIPELWFEKIIKEFNKNTKIVAISGPCRYYDLGLAPRLTAGLIWWITSIPAYLSVGYLLLSGNFVVKKDALNKIGGFNTSIPFFGDDTDTARRLSSQGKVKFKINFFINTSGRRLIKDGLFKSYIIYGLNFLWVVFLGKPLTKVYKDHR